MKAPKRNLSANIRVSYDVGVRSVPAFARGGWKTAPGDILVVRFEGAR
jgi:hypothetical protein